MEYEFYSTAFNLMKYNKYQYDNLVMLLPSGSKGETTTPKTPRLTIRQILDFFDSPEKNVMIVADSAVYQYTRKLANEFGVDFEPQGSHISDGTDTVLSSNVFSESASIVSPTSGISYSGVGLRLDRTNNRVFPFLSANRSSYSVDENGVIINEGRNLVLTAAYQVPPPFYL